MNSRRLRGLIRKEFLQILRDPSAIAIAFFLPVFLLFLFGYGVSLDARHIPLAVVVDQPTAETSAFVGGLQQSFYFAPKLFPSMQQAQAALMERRVDGIVWLRSNFSRQILQGNTASIGVFVNGVDANNARIAEGYLQGSWQNWLQQRALAAGQPLIIPVDGKDRIWFNPALRSRDYLVPGLIAVIMTLIGALLTALVVAREWERGTMEALMATPAQMAEILLGKLVPYYAMGMGGMLLSVGLAVWLFAVPLRGSFAILLLASTLFLLVALGMGLLISSVARNQFVAGQIAIIVTFLPAFILSGFIFYIPSMPAAIQVITHIVAARYFVSILQTLFLAGDVWPIILWNSVALLLMAIFFLGVTLRRSHKRLD
ncbi:ABC transporter permease [Candidatus Igneacidithiobacillus taiwanensis]|uniref:ABC transporter permease n=1 Tax=Candidatus Igneacidithiobacillus taiwanensis TaxID=1945924 RepID=UPI00289AA57C|nr:ABC transporter permease [Candidatus Igneacidithiobacillus taiwanensis]